jgi:hypothetical protein
MEFKDYLLWCARREAQVQIAKHPGAVTLGRRKLGVREAKSEKKAAAARMNGLAGGRPRTSNVNCDQASAH